MKVVSVKDLAIDAYITPFFVQTVGQAIRMFTDEVNREGSQIRLHPKDYTLYLIGDFDEEKGDLQGLFPTAIARANEVLKPLSNEE